MSDQRDDRISLDVDALVAMSGEQTGSTVPPPSGPCSAPQLPSAPLVPPDLETRPGASSGQETGGRSRYQAAVESALGLPPGSADDNGVDEIKYQIPKFDSDFHDPRSCDVCRALYGSDWK